MAGKYHIGRDKMPHPCKANIRECEFAQNGHDDLEMMSKVSEMLLEREYKQNMESLKKIKTQGGVQDTPAITSNTSEVEQYVHPQGKVITVNPDGSLTVTKDGKPATSSATLEQLRNGRGAWKRDDGTPIEIKPRVARSKERQEPKTFSQVREGDELEVTYVRPPSLTGNAETDYEVETVKVTSVKDGDIEFSDGTGIYLHGRRWAFGSGANQVKLNKVIKMSDIPEPPKVKAPKISAIDKRVAEYASKLPDEKLTLENFNKDDFGGRDYDDLVFDRVKVTKDILGLSKYTAQDEVLEKVMEAEERWNIPARTTPPKPGDKHVPVRLIPVGSTVNQYTTAGHNVVIGRPHNNGKMSRDSEHDEIVGTYHDGIQRQYVQPNTTWTVNFIPPNKINSDGSVKLPSAWRHENEVAEELGKLREAIREHNSKF